MDLRELEGQRRRARELVEKEGLDPYPVEFAIVDKEELDELAAYEGFPERYPHWRFGMEYDHQKKRSSYGGMRLYELVLNSSPALAYLREDNTAVQNKAVMVHVYAHADFFAHNKWYKGTGKSGIKMMRDHAERIESYMESEGVEAVESFVDKVLSLKMTIDQYGPFLQRRTERGDEGGEGNEEGNKIPVKRDYMDRFVNPPEKAEQGGKDLKGRQGSKTGEEVQLPTSDLLGFLGREGKLEEWQREILAALREESYYFAPQMMTKVMNEGWAAYWQSKIMSERGFAKDSEFLDHADMQSRVLGSGGLNPYMLGKRIWEDVKERWDKGRHGREWENCRDREKRKNWDREEERGREKIFEVRSNLNDVSFLDRFFTREVFQEMNLFTYEWVQGSGQYHITSKDFEPVKRKLLFQFTNMGRPTIKVQTGNFENRGELLLVHEFNGVNLHLGDARRVLKNVYSLWGKPVNLKTVREKSGRITQIGFKERDPFRRRSAPEKQREGLLLRCAGSEIEEKKLDLAQVEELIFDSVDYDTVPDSWRS